MNTEPHEHDFRHPLTINGKTYYVEWTVIVDAAKPPNALGHQRECRHCGIVEFVPYTGGPVGALA